MNKLLRQSHQVFVIDLKANNQMSQNMNFQDFIGDINNEDFLKEITSELCRSNVNLSGIVNCYFHPELFNPEELIFTGDRLKDLDLAFRSYSINSYSRELIGNLTGVHQVIQNFLPKDLTLDFSVVNIGSVYGIRQPSQVHFEFADKFMFKPPGYGVSKAALIAYTEYLANLYAGTNFRFNVVAPGFIDHDQDLNFKSRFNHRLSIRRFATLDEIVGPIEFLLSDNSKYITGSTIIVDGGYTKT